jgi:hypothetical protein
VAFQNKDGNARLLAGVSNQGKGTLWIDEEDPENDAGTPADAEVQGLIGAVRRWMRR